jgi:hypothetical protein
MVPSNIPDFSFVKQMFRGTASDNSQCTFGWGDFNSRYWSCGRTKSWSSMSQSDLPNLQKYVEAMNHCFSLYTNIHFEEIKLIMHGWGLITFFQSGYDAFGHFQGGIYANPNQSLAGYLNFTYNMGDLGEFMLSHLIPLNNIKYLVELSYLSQNVGATIGSGGNTDMLEYAFNLLKLLETTPIRSVLEDTLTVDHIYNDIWPNGLKTPHSDSMYDQLRDNIATFEKYGNPYKFNRLEAYNEEIDRIISMKAFYKY